jgi:exodeoxyribonuclease VII small subunit
MTKDFNYQKAQTELDELLAWFESADVTIDEAIAKYEQAEKLIAQIETYLNDTRSKIEIITKNAR